MDIVLIHLGDKVPNYYTECFMQIKQVTDLKVYSYIQGVSCQYDIKSEKIDQFNDIGFFKDDFWKFTCERFFYLEAFMRHLGIQSALHIENDNLLYVNPARYEDALKRDYKDKIAIAPITEQLDGAGIMYIDSVEALSNVNNLLLELMSKGRQYLTDNYGPEMLNEMRLLNIIRNNLEGPIGALPVLPDSSIDSFYVFDPASYGQYVDGTHQKPGVEWKEERHIVGKRLINQDLRVYWNKRRNIPIAFDHRYGEHCIVNLHIHSKQLSKWVTYGR